MAHSDDLTQAKYVLITGCSEGNLGESIAKEYHEKGLHVIATTRNSKEDPLRTLTSLGLLTFELDVTSAESIDAVYRRVRDLSGGKLHVLVNNAIITYPYSFADSDMDRVKELFDTNFFGAMAMCQKFLPLLLASEDARILQIGSVSGVVPVPYGAAYNASKAALHSLGDTLRLELAPFGIKVTTVILGNVKTDIVRTNAVLPENSIYQPVKAEYQARRIDNFHAGALPRGPVARDIVAETLKRSPRAWFWSGKNVWLTWILTTFLGRRGADGILTKMFGLNKLAAINAAKRRKID